MLSAFVYGMVTQRHVYGGQACRRRFCFENGHAFFRKVYFCPQTVFLFVIRYDYGYFRKHQTDGERNSMQGGGRISS